MLFIFAFPKKTSQNKWPYLNHEIVIASEILCTHNILFRLFILFLRIQFRKIPNYENISLHQSRS